jgi:tetratricopeptide (TPR) repeat protein
MRLKTGSILIILLLVSAIVSCSDQARRASYVARANKYFEAEDYAKAEIEYLNVLRLDHVNTNAIVHLASIYFEEGRPVRAFPVVMKALELEPNYPGLHTKAATLYFAVGDLKRARQQAIAALDQSFTNGEAAILLAQWARTPKDIEEVRLRLEKLRRQTGPNALVEVALGNLDVSAGDLGAASAAFTNALLLDPRCASAHYALGSVYWTQNNQTNADLEFRTAADLAPLRSLQRLRYADFKVQIGEVEQGKEILSRITQIAPDYLPAWIELAQIALAQKQLTNCATLISEALQRDPDNYDTLLLRARLKLAIGDGDAAISECERLTMLYKNSPQVFYQLALAYLYKGDVAKALKSVNQAVTLDPEFDNAVLMQADLNIQRDHADSAIESLVSLISRQPRLPLAYLLTANAYIAKGNYDEAIATCMRLQNVYPRNAQVQSVIGGLYLRKGKKNEARQAFEQALEFSPEYFPALEQVINLDLSEKNYDSALKQVRSQLARAPQSPQLHVLLGQVLMTETNIDDAERALQKAIDLDPNYRPSYLILADLYVHSKRQGKAIQKLNEEIGRNPSDTGALMLVGMIQNDIGDFSAARTNYERLLKINPNFVPALNNLAYLYSEKFEMPDKAFEMARKARDLAPNDPALEDTLGWILFQRHEYSWALSLLQASAEKLPNEAEVQFHLGMAYYAMDDESRAAKQLSRALESSKGFSGKDQIKAYLRVLAMRPEKGGAEMLSELQQQTTRNSQDIVALVKIAQVYKQEKSFARAAETYERVIRLNRSAPFMISLADLYFEELKNPSRAMDLAKEAYKLEPDDEHVSHTLGRLAYAEGDYKWALSLLQQCVQNQPSTPASYYDLAWAFYSVGHVQKAQEAMQSALKSDPSFSNAAQAKQFLDLTAVAGNPARALESESQAEGILRSDDGNIPALMVVAAVFRQKGELAAASKIYESVLVKFPDFVPAIKQLAISAADHQSSDDKRAYDLAIKARAELPDDIEVARALGILSFRRGDFQGAARLLSQAVQGGIGDGPTLYYLGMSYYQLKDNRQSKDMLQQSLNLQLQPQLAEEAKRTLKSLK